MNLKKLVSIQSAGYYGLAFPITLIVCIILAIYFSPWFNITENWFSRLGGDIGETPIWGARGLGSVIFNFGIIASGVLGILFSVSIIKSKYLNTRFGRLGKYILLADMIALCGIGIFPATLLILHRICSFIFFSLSPLVLFFMSSSVGKIYGKKIWLILNMFCILGIVQLAVVIYFKDFLILTKAIGELFVTFSFFVFCALLSIKLLDFSKLDKKYTNT